MQLISYDGATATSPAGKYAGVNLSYTIVAGQVRTSPVLIHLPRIDNAETVQVQQNSLNPQVFNFQTIPGLEVTVYAGTKFSLEDGSQPNPFPLTAIEIPIDRLPDAIPTSGMLTPFIVAFQPANAYTNQPVSVNFPNTLNYPPGTHATFVTLDPTHGYMVPYGTGTVSMGGTQFVADNDPNHSGHSYGLVHFDWHGPMPAPPSGVNPSPDGSPSGASNGSPGGGFCSLNGSANPASPAPLACNVGSPVDVSSGIVNYTSTDLQIVGSRGSLAINRYYRTLAAYKGPFGIGTAHNYSYTLNTYPYVQGQGIIVLVTPDGNQFTMSQTPDGTFANATIPALRGAVLTAAGTSGPYTLRWVNGTQYQFTVFTNLGAREAFLTSIIDLNGNTTTLALNPGQPQQILTITDPVGRALNLTYDGSNRITQITDPLGRQVNYTYNNQGSLATFTDANGGITNYAYDAANYLISITDPRGVVTEQNTYNEGFDGRVIQQVEADGGVFQFAYGLLGGPIEAIGGTPTAVSPTSPVLTTVVTDPLGHQTTYRFNSQSFLVSATDPTGQTRILTRDASHNNLVSAYTGAGVCPVCGNPRAGNLSFTFDQFGNTLTRTDALGNTTVFTYDNRFSKIKSVTDPLNHTTTITYDANGNPLTFTDANGNTTQLAFDSFGDLVQVADPLGFKTTAAYDSFGNISSITDALGHISHFTYDAVSRITSAVDALGQTSAAAYDALNRVTSLTDPRGDTTSFTYDPISDLLSFKDARGNSTQYTYDAVGRLQTRTSALGNIDNYIYDLDSNLVQYTDRRRQVSTFQYDALSRLTQEAYTDATVTGRYDANSRLISVNDSAGGAFGFGYDAAGRLLLQEEPTGIVEYTRDALGRVATRQVDGQPSLQYTYDPAGNMLAAAMPTAGVTYQYDVRNLPRSLTRTNGVVTNYAFDPLGQVLSLIHSKGVTSLNTQNYTYDAIGNRSAISNDISQALITHSAKAAVDNGNQLLTDGGTTFTYDANGNRLTETSASSTTTYLWDGRNRLSSVKDSSGNTTTMQYDFNRNLLGVSQTIAGATTIQKFVVDSLTNVVSLTGTSGAPVSVLTGRYLDSHYTSADAAGDDLFGLGDALGRQQRCR